MSSSCSPFSLLRIIEQEFSTHFDLLTTSNGISEFKMVSECILWTGAKCKVCGCTLPGLNFFAKNNALSSTRQLLSWYFILFVFLRYFICFSYVFIPWDNLLTLFRVITARLGTPATENVDSANDISLHFLDYIIFLSNFLISLYRYLGFRAMLSQIYWLPETSGLSIGFSLKRNVNRISNSAITNILIN